jgi:hypothetical protein
VCAARTAVDADDDHRGDCVVTDEPGQGLVNLQFLLPLERRAGIEEGLAVEQEQDRIPLFGVRRTVIAGG